MRAENSVQIHVHSCDYVENGFKFYILCCLMSHPIAERSQISIVVYAMLSLRMPVGYQGPHDIFHLRM